MQPTPPEPPKDPIRPHVFDGIQEYDNRLPNWWLYTLYLTILYAVGYWGYYEWMRIGESDTAIVDSAMAKIATERLASAKLDDPSLWKMSQNATFVAAGQEVFTANCVACHLASLRGKSETAVAIGPDLTDQIWIHGGKPTEIYELIMKGVLTKGMPTWGPILGAKKISAVTAFILSKHHEGEPVAAAEVVTK
jgi:cytochrome c oxidase cbb3-type subunit 3